MYYGITTTLKPEIVNNLLKSYGSAIMPMGTLSLYFKNIIPALYVSHYLKQKNNKFKYSCCILSEDQIKGKTFIKSIEDYKNYVKDQERTLINACLTDMTEKELEI